MDTIDSLKNALQVTDSPVAIQALPGADQKIKLLLVEDISSEIVGILGSHYEIDPRFFETHVRNPADHRDFHDGELNRIRNVHDSKRLLVCRFHQQWIQICNARRSMGDPRRIHWSHLRNVDRFISTLPFQVRYPASVLWPQKYRFPSRRTPIQSEGAQSLGGIGITTIDTRTTIWIGQDRTCSNTTVGIVLLDFTEPNSTDMLPNDNKEMVPERREAFVHVPTLDNLETSSADFSPEAWCNDIIDMTMRYPWFDTSRSLNNVEKLTIVCPSLYTICAEWLELVNNAQWEVAELEATFKDESSRISPEYRISAAMRQPGEWREHIQSWREMVAETLETGIVNAQRLTQEPSPNLLDDITLDFERVLQKLNDLLNRIDGHLDRGTSEMQLEAARQSLKESHDLALLSWLATIFIPLTYVTGLFSMSEDLGSMKSTFKAYFAIAIPVALIALIIARWAHHFMPYPLGIARGTWSLLCNAWHRLTSALEDAWDYIWR